jgi:hypothetical protein
MADSTSSSRKTHWSDAEVDALLDFLFKNRSKIGGTTFKDGTYNDAAKEIAKLKIQGQAKTGAQCKNKWNAVCFLSCHLVIIDC